MRLGGVSVGCGEGHRVLGGQCGGVTAGGGCLGCGWVMGWVWGGP